MNSPENPAVPARGTRVFVVEDEAMIRMLLEDMLGELGCTIAAARLAFRLVCRLCAFTAPNSREFTRSRERLWITRTPETFS